MNRWSKLQKEVYLITDPTIDFQIHCSTYRMQSQRGSTSLPRYWITLNRKVIFDYPKQFLKQPITQIEERWCRDLDSNTLIDMYPYYTNISDISNLIRQYLDTPKAELFSKEFVNDRWGLTNILKAADRRIGKRRLDELARRSANPVVQQIISVRIRRDDI